MDSKSEFTKLIMSAKSIARREVTSLSDLSISDGAGAIGLNQKGEAGYDLRSPALKGVLAKSHPVRLAAKLRPVSRLNEVLKSIAQTYGIKNASLALGAKGARLYTDPFGPLPKDLDPSGQIVELEGGVSLKLGSEDSNCDLGENEAFFSMYLEYAHFVLFNQGHGRISQIQSIASSFLPSTWTVSGCWIQAPGPFDIESLMAQGIIVEPKHAKEGVFCLPNSGFDYQYQDMLTRLLKAEE